MDQGMNAGGSAGAGGVELRPRGIGEILSTAFELYTKNWQALVTLVAVVAIPLGLITYFVVDRLIRKSVTVSSAIGQNGTIVVHTTGDAWRPLLGAGLLQIVAVLITLVLTGAITREAAGVFIGKTFTLGDAYAFGLARLGPILWISFLVILIFAGVALVLVLLALALSGIVVLLAMLAFVAYLILYTRLIATIPSLVVENQRGTMALSRSWQLTKGRSWPVFGTLIVALLITAIVSGIITAPFGRNWFIRGILNGVAESVTLPFTSLVTVLIYLDLRVRKESLDRARLQSDLATSAP